MSVTYYKKPAILNEPGLTEKHAVIEASAGTGKTFTLEHLVLELIISGKAKVEEILVVTFTEAATRELRERVRSLIRRVCDEGSRVKPNGSSASFWVIDDGVRNRLREALFRFDGAAISTIHGFCQRILSEQAFLGGRPFEQEHASGSEMFGLAFREEIRAAMVEESPVGKLLRLWIEQGFSLTALQELLYKCHREGCPDRCPVTPIWDPQGFRKAIKELPPADDLKAAGEILFTNKTKYNSFAGHIDRLHDTMGCITKAENLLEAADLFKAWAHEKRSLAGENDTQIDNLRRAAQMHGSPDALRKLTCILDKMDQRAAPASSFFTYQLLPRIQARLAARKRSLGLLDYDDMLIGVWETLTKDGSASLINTLRQRWKFALVDEFQDTDVVQWEIFRIIFVDGTEQHRLVVIGDPKQAIYGFRGADVHTYETARLNLTRDHNALQLALKENYRSTEPLIEAVNEILTVKSPAGNSFFDGLNRYNDPVKCGNLLRRANQNGKTAAAIHLLRLYDPGKELKAATLKKGLACFISDEILRLVHPQEGLVTSDGDNELQPIRYGDIYILTRTIKEGREMGQVLRQYGIPHAFYKQEGLYQTKEAADIYRLLCAIDTPTEPAARMSAWLTPFFGLPLSELPAWQEAGENHPLTTLLLKWKELAEIHAWPRLFEDIVTESGLARRMIFFEEDRALTNYLHLFELLLSEAHSRPLTLSELARGLKARIDERKLPEGSEGNVQRLETEKDSVQILTMHKAKGLEAEVVFLGGGFSDGFRGSDTTHIYHIDNRRHLHFGKAGGKIAEAIERENREEDQRLLYVALTRAKSRLYLPYFAEAPKGAPEHYNYSYKRLGKMYRALQESLELAFQNSRTVSQTHFKLRDVSCQKQLPAGLELSNLPQGWPAKELLEMPQSGSEEAARLERAHRGILLTSYTRLSREKSWHPPQADPDDRAAWRNEEVESEFQPEDSSSVSLAADSEQPDSTPQFPGGREAGILLHALLEDTSGDEICGLTLTEWTALTQVQKRAGALIRRHGFEIGLRPEALRLTYNALSSPVNIDSIEENSRLHLPGGIASGSCQRAEMAFVYPIPENFHPLFTTGSAAGDINSELPYQALRGYIQGLIDLVFEHEDKVYLLDWKSDRLPSFSKKEIIDHVDANYSLQAQVYALAIIRLLSIKTAQDYEQRFGGILYAFIRGIHLGESGQEGLWFSRPPWTEIVSWEQSLITRNNWGGSVIEPIQPEDTVKGEQQ